MNYLGQLYDNSVYLSSGATGTPGSPGRPGSIGASGGPGAPGRDGAPAQPGATGGETLLLLFIQCSLLFIVFILKRSDINHISLYPLLVYYDV